MKQIEQVFDPLREQLKSQSPEGSLRPIYLATPRTERLYLMKIPVPGFGVADISLKKTLGAFTIFARDEFGVPSYRFEYDEEFLDISDWTVLNGVAMIVIKFTVPEKYLEINVVDSISPDTFLTKYNQTRG